jgi:hypothetical protein
VDLKSIGESPVNLLNGDQADVVIDVNLTDVRNAGDLSDYTGELRAVVGLRITDRLNGGSNEGGTVTDAPLSFSVPCSATPGPEGGDCSLSTTADAITAGIATEGKRSIWELAGIEVHDGGADGDADTTGDNEPFAVQGLFAP